MLDVLFLTSTDKLTLNHEVNGTMLLATKLLQDGFRADILRFCQIESYQKDYDAFIGAITEQILNRAPKVLSCYTLWGYYHIMLRIAREVKFRNPDIRIVLGGPQASLTAAATLRAADYVDFICTGEGENTVVPFFRTLLRGSGAFADIPGLAHRQDGEIIVNRHDIPLCDLNTLPYWDDRLFCDSYDDSARLTSSTYFMPIDAGRGCPFSCTFCCSSGFWHRMYRMKSPERIVADMKYWNQKFGIRSFLFSHDAFTVNRKLVTAVCDRILEEKLPFTWRCTSRIDCLTEELILKMKQAGMTQIEFGIESGSQRMQKIINKKLNLERAKHMVDFLRKEGILISAFFIYGLPEETEEDLNQTLELCFTLMDWGAQYTSLSFCHFNPDTQITRQYFDKLVFDPNIQIVARGIFGFRNELPLIMQEKEIFPFFYHLPTPIRDNYQYLAALRKLYEYFPIAARQLRRQYHGDNLRFYRDFLQGNQEYFDAGIETVLQVLSEDPLSMLRKTVQQLDPPCIRQLLALAEYELDLRTVSRSNSDMTLQKTYAFSIFDLKLKLPIEQYAEGRTEILLRKENRKFSQRVLRSE